LQNSCEKRHEVEVTVLRNLQILAGMSEVESVDENLIRPRNCVDLRLPRCVIRTGARLKTSDS
jgi:hypothetical protein